MEVNLKIYKNNIENISYNSFKDDNSRWETTIDSENI